MVFNTCTIFFVSFKYFQPERVEKCNRTSRCRADMSDPITPLCVQEVQEMKRNSTIQSGYVWSHHFTLCAREWRSVTELHNAERICLIPSLHFVCKGGKKRNRTSRQYTLCAREEISKKELWVNTLCVRERKEAKKNFESIHFGCKGEKKRNRTSE